MDIRHLYKDIKSMYDVTNVKTGFDYWFYKILNLLLQMFEYEGLPDSIPQREIELNLLLTGHSVIVPRTNGTLFAPITSIFGLDEYYQPTECVFANPVVRSSKNWRIHEDCEIIYNSSLQDSVFYIKADSGLLSFIGRYARQLADVESTINIYSVNSRLTSIPVTDDNNVATSIKTFFKALAGGKREIVTDSTMVERFRNIDINRTSIKDGINDWLVARDKILEQMYRDIGVRMYNPKRAQVTESELESNDQLLLISTEDMLNARREGLERVNDMYGTNITVKLNDRFDISQVMYEESEVTQNENDNRQNV